MWSPRVQSDRMRFAEDWRLMLEQTKNLDFYQEMVTGLIVEGDTVKGGENFTRLTDQSKVCCVDEWYFFKWINSYWR